MNGLSKLLTTAAVVLLVPLAGCNDNDDDGGAPGTTFFGTYADQAGNAGLVELTGVSPLTSVRAVLGAEDGATLMGELRIGGRSPIPLNGLYEPTTGSLAFASDDGTYNFNGTVSGGRATGFGFGPGGPATFVVFLGGTEGSVGTYCGTATCTSPPGCDATASFNLAVSGGDALMTVNVDGSVAVATGTEQAGDVAIQIDGEQVLTVTGDISGNDVSGTWTDATNGTSGTWKGSATECRSAKP